MAPSPPSGSCSGCSQPSPCVSQGICLDPTVLRPEGSAEDAYLIEGQLVRATGDGSWTPTVLPRAADGAIEAALSEEEVRQHPRDPRVFIALQTKLHYNLFV
jgi:hypothetical protein